MKKYLLLYLSFIRLNFSLLITYKANLLGNIISSLGWGVFSVIGMVLLTSRTPTVYGWTRDEILIFTGCVNIIFSLHRALFARNFHAFADLIYLGKLDMILTKPVNAQFVLSFNHINFVEFIRVIAASLFVVFMISISNISVSLLSVMSFLFIVILSLTLMYSIWLLVLTLLFWFPTLTNLTELMYEIDHAARFPQGMYKRLPMFVFTIIFPLTLIAFIPTKTLLNQVSALELGLLIFLACMFFVVSKTFFQFALRYYSSASS